MMTLFHGSPYCFKYFQFRAQSEQEGIRLGYPIFLTNSEPLAAMYSDKKGCPRPEHHYLYTVQIPDLTPDNHFFLDGPVSRSIVKRAEEYLHTTIPVEATATGKAFKDWLESLGGKRRTLEERKLRAVCLLHRFGVVAIAWQYKRSRKGVINYAIMFPGDCHVQKCEHIEYKFMRQADGKSHLTIYERYEVEPFDNLACDGKDDVLITHWRS